MMHKFFICLVVLFSLFSCKKGPEKVDFGNIEGKIYQNDYFDLEIPVLSGWQVESLDVLKENTMQGNQILDESGDLDMVFLYAAYKQQQNSNFPYFMVLAERLGQDRTAMFHLQATKNKLQKSGVYKDFSEVKEKQIGGKKFIGFSTKVNQSEVTLQQTYWFYVVKDYCLALVLTYENPEQEMDLEALIQGIQL